MARVTLKNVFKRFGALEVVHGINLDINDNEFIVLVGPSGCGKSTTLRMIAGLEEISQGVVEVDGKVVNHIPPKGRNMAMVFQNYALYPHMTVSGNMGFSLKLAGRPQAEIEKRVGQAADILGLSELLDRRPSELSGGQRQRVAMGRAIVRKPEVFLFDEPLSNLDAQLRTTMRMELKKLHLSLKTTTIYVTHDQVEAMTLADRIVIMNDGHILQTGTPIEVYQDPANLFVAGFIGNPPINVIPARLATSDSGPFLNAGELAIPLPEKPGKQPPPAGEMLMGIRPEDILAGHQAKALDESWRFKGRVIIAETLGGQSLIEASFSGQNLVAFVDGHFTPAPGEEVTFGFRLENLHLFDPRSEVCVF